MTRTGSYIATIKPEFLVQARNRCNVFTKMVNDSLAEQGADYRFRITAKGRLGKKNPYARRYYGRRSAYTIENEHAERIDLYVHRRYVDGLRGIALADSAMEVFMQCLTKCSEPYLYGK